jgi:hypothetical protein
MLKAQKFLKQKNSEKIVFLENVFSIFFAAGLSPCNYVFFDLLCKKYQYPKIQVI